MDNLNVINICYIYFILNFECFISIKAISRTFRVFILFDFMKKLIVWKATLNLLFITPDILLGM